MFVYHFLKTSPLRLAAGPSLCKKDIYTFSNVCPFDYTAAAVSCNVGNQ